MNNNDYLVKNFVTIKHAWYGLNPFLQEFSYNTFCLSKIKNCIDLMSINEKIINLLNELNTCQKYIRI
jgi:hypothetical protein